MINSMKLILYLLVLGSFVLPQNEWCGSVPPSMDYFSEIGFEIDPANREIIVVRTFIHILRHSDGSYGITLEQAEAVNDSLNSAFLPYNIQFELMGIDEILNTQLFTNIHDTTLYFQNSSDDRVDIYIAPGPTEEAPTISYAQGHFGQADNQPNPGLSISGDLFNAIPCDDPLYNQELFNTPVIVHEMGHVFGLFHTHDTTNCIEQINGSNCHRCGDFICDTPAAPNIVCRYVDNETCEYIGEVIEPGTELEYNPDVDNYMAYTYPYCLNHFTQGQTDYMHSWITSDSSLLQVISEIYEMKTFHSGWNWVGFPHLSDNEDGEVGNNPDPVEDIFNPIENNVSSIEITSYIPQITFSSVWDGFEWSISDNLIGVESTKGYKVQLPEDQEIYEIRFDGLSVTENARVNLFTGENWVPYFIQEPQCFTDAFPENVLDKIQTIKSENWFIFKNYNGQFIMNQICPEMYMDGGSILDCYQMEYGAMYEIVVNQDIILNWNIPEYYNNSIVPVYPLISERFPYEKKDDYIPIVIESIETENEIEEIGAKKIDKFVGAEFVGGFPVNMRVYDNSLTDLTFEIASKDDGLGRQAEDTESNRLLGISESRIENGVVFVQLTDVGDVPVESPKLFSLVSAYPNPMNPGIEIHFSLMKDAKVELGIYDILGRKVKTLIHGNLTTSSYSYTWAGTAEDGSTVSSGVYFYRLQSDGEVIQNKIMLLK